MKDELMLKELSNILCRVNDEEKEEIMNQSRKILDQSLGHDAAEADRELRKKSQEEFRKLKLQRRMSIQASAFEKMVLVMKLIAEKIDCGRKFRIVLEYDPELLSTSIDYFWD